MFVRMIIRYYNIINNLKASFIASVRNSDFTTHNYNILRKENIQNFTLGQFLRCLSVWIQPAEDLASTASVAWRTSSKPLRICGCTAWMRLRR